MSDYDRSSKRLQSVKKPTVFKSGFKRVASDSTLCSSERTSKCSRRSKLKSLNVDLYDCDTLDDEKSSDDELFNDVEYSPTKETDDFSDYGSDNETRKPTEKKSLRCSRKKTSEKIVESAKPATRVVREVKPQKDLPRQTKSEIPGYYAKCVQWKPINSNFFDELVEKILTKHDSDLANDRIGTYGLQGLISENVATLIEPYFAALSEVFLTEVAAILTYRFPQLRDSHRSSVTTSLASRIGNIARKRRYQTERTISVRKVIKRAVP